MSKGLERFLQALKLEWMNRVLFVIPIVSLVLAGLLYYREWKVTEDVVTKHEIQKQRVITNAGARSVEEFLSLLSNSLLLLSRHLSLEADFARQSMLDNYYADWKDTVVTGVIVTDEEGVVRYSSGRTGRPGLGMIMSERDYYRWSVTSEEGEVYLGDPIISKVGSQEGKYILTISTGLFEDGNYKGVIAIGIPIDDLTNRYLKELKLSDQTGVHLLDTEGTFLYSTYEDLTGVNLYEYLKGLSFPGSEHVLSWVKNEISNAGDEGSLVYKRPAKRSLTEHLMTYKKVCPMRSSVRNGCGWYLVIEKPSELHAHFYEPFFNSQNLNFVFVVLLLLVFSGFGFLSLRISQRDSYLKGFIDGRKKKEEIK